MYPVNQLLIILLGLFILIIISYWLKPDIDIGFNQPKMNSKTHSGIDPITYNMKQIIKQSILLEKYLSEPNKRCRDCIVKHFLHIRYLHEEALWLANEKCGNYPMLIETTSFYSEQYDEWINAYDDDKTLLQIAGKLREVRKKLVSLYDENKTEDTVLIKKENKDYREVLNDVRISDNFNANSPKPGLNNLSINSYERIY